MAKVYDAYGNEVVTNEQSFTLTQENVKIHDAKFETKTTTFLKDAFKRFCKNKSSIVGAIIIGILVLLSIIVPIVSPYDVITEDSYVAKLRPRLFDTGFWSGEETKYGIAYDTVNEVPVGHNKDAVVEILDRHIEIIQSTTDYAINGGVYVVMTEKKTVDIYLNSYATFGVNTEGGYTLAIKMEDLGEVFKNIYSHGEYRILLSYNHYYDKTNDVNTFDSITLQDWTTEIKDYNFDLSAILASNEVDSIEDAKVRFELKSDKTKTNLYYIGVASVVISCSEAEGLEMAHGTVGEEIAQKDLLAEISLTNANSVLKMTKNQATGKFDNAYWQSNGLTSVTNLEIVVVDFVYNKYFAVFGNADKTIGKSTIDDYVKLGYMEYDFETGISSFKILDPDRCPIEQVYEQITNTATNTVYLKCEVCQYKEKGFTSMPKYLFGTDDSGFDLFTKCFTNLLRSLILAIVTSAICFAFGLVWGAISGYFGGTVDLMMERFVEILGGVPWVVVMTLVLLVLEDTEIIIRLGIAMCLTGWMGTAGVTRTQFYRFKGREYILASRTLGANDMRLIFKHILPNSMGTIITSSVLKIPACIFTESSLAYLGLLKGTNSFGTILSDNQQYISTYPVLILFPAFIISLLMISFNLFGNGLRDAFNPSLKGSE